MYYTNRMEYQCYNARGKRVDVAFDLHQAAALAGEGGEIVLEHSVGESTWRVRDGVATLTR